MAKKQKVLAIGYSRGFFGAFFGRPLPGTLRIASRADLSYMAPRIIGIMPARNNRISTVFCGIPRASANLGVMLSHIYS